MTIYALKGPSRQDFDTDEELAEVQKYLAASIMAGVSRFGWSYAEGKDTKNTSDLHVLEKMPWEKMSADEVNCWTKANFLMGVNIGDWVVHINLPEWGQCIAGRVVEPYSFDLVGNDFGDYRHLLKLDKESILEFDRNDNRVNPVISSRLKLQGRFWTIQYNDEFVQTLTDLRNANLKKPENESVGRYYVKKEFSPMLGKITALIQKNNPGSKLESFIAEIFRNVPSVVDVKEHGRQKGWGTDNGADLIVTYRSGLPISELETQECLVVQVKSYTDLHWETNAVNQIEDAIKVFGANAGLLITTAESTPNLEKAIEELSSKLARPESDGGLNKQIPIGLISGDAVAKFVLKFGSDLIL